MKTSCDTNILFRAFHPKSARHEPAIRFLKERAEDQSFAICELCLMEFYGLLRNPSVVERPLSPQAAVEACAVYRRNRHWLVIDYPGGLMDEVWRRASEPGFARRRIYDVRLALTLRRYGVSEFATSNPVDFEGFGFDRVWDPLL